MTAAKKRLCDLTTADIDHRDYLHWMCMEGYKKWVLPGIEGDEAKQAEYMERLDYELDVIEKMGFIDYFLIVQDYVNYARDHDMPTGPGRGCLTAGTLVDTANRGCIPVEAVVVGDTVYDARGRECRVRQTFRYDADEEVLAFSVRRPHGHGVARMGLTADHKVLVEIGPSAFEWRAARELAVGDTIAHDDSGRSEGHIVSSVSTAAVKGFVYDLSVETDTEPSYRTDCGVVHNSAAGSLVSYLSGITRVDPLQFGLYFERFLNPDRIGMPDIDVDFPQSKRQEIMEYTRQRYGTERAAQVMTFGYERPKGSIKDMARVLGYPPNLADRITKTISDDLKATIDSELALDGEFTQLYNSDPDVKRIVDAAKRIEGLVRGDSIHASAFVIAPYPIADHMPMQTPKGQQGKMSAEDTANFIVQFDGTTVEKLGYLKMDFLGLGNLDAIANTQRLIEKIHGKRIELEDVPFDDKKTLALLRRGETAGLFQVESEGMIKTLKQVQPTKFSEISDIIALYRPGPMEYIPIYVEGKNDPDSIQYLDPRLKPILEETYGVACVAEGSRVATSTGEKPIEAVEPGEMVLTEDGTYQRCLARWDNGAKETVVVRTDFGEELRCTPDHEILTQFGWVPAGDLTKDHLIKAYLPTVEPRTPEEFDWEDWLVGLFLADGYSSPTGSPSIACCSEEFALQVKGIVERCFPDMQGVSVYSTSNGIGTTWYVRLSQRSGYNGQFSRDYAPNEFNEVLRKHGLYRASREKKSWPTDYSISTVIGFMEGDGCYINRRVNLKYEHIARGLYEALLSYGIRASLFRRDEAAWSVAFDYNETIAPRFRTYNGRPSRGYFVPKSHLLPYAESMARSDWKNLLCGKKGEVPYVSTRAARRQGWSEDDGSHPLWGRVLSVKPGPNTPVYDLSIEGNHSFVTGGLVVSNCYQESLMEIAKVLAGFTMAEADTLRKAIGKKLDDLMASLKGKFIDGCMNNPDGGLTEDKAEALWALMEAAGNYSFNKSHSVAYAYLAWYTAYFKANYPAEFMCSMMSYRKDHPKAAEFLTAFFRDCRRYGVAVLPPHVNRSGIDFDVNAPMEISFGLAALKGIGDGPAGFIVAEREANGPYRDLNDFLVRMDTGIVNAGVVEKLAKSGALDGLGWTRKALTEGIEDIKAFSKALKAGSRHSEDQGTFDFLDEVELATIDPGTDEEYGPDELLEMEKQNLGFYLSGDPLEYYEVSRRLKARGIPAARLRNVSDLHALDDGEEIHVFGSVARLKRHQTQKGDWMAFVSLADFGKAQESVRGLTPERYEFDTVVFPRSYAEWGHRLREGDFLLVRGKIKVRSDDGRKSLAAEEASILQKDSRIEDELAGDPGMAAILADVKRDMEAEYERWSKPAPEGEARLEIDMPADNAGEFLAVIDKYRGTMPATLVVDGRRKDLGSIDYSRKMRSLLDFLEAKVRMLDA